MRYVPYFRVLQLLPFRVTQRNLCCMSTATTRHQQKLGTKIGPPPDFFFLLLLLLSPSPPAIATALLSPVPACCLSLSVGGRSLLPAAATSSRLLRYVGAI